MVILCLIGKHCFGGDTNSFSLIPTRADLFAETSGSVGIGYNVGMSTAVEDLAIRTSLAPNLSLGAVVVRDKYGYGVAPFAPTITGRWHGLELFGAAGLGYDKSDFGVTHISKVMSYLAVGASYPIQIKKLVIAPSITIANRNTRQGADYLFNVTIKFRHGLHE